MSTWKKRSYLKFIVSEWMIRINIEFKYVWYNFFQVILRWESAVTRASARGCVSGHSEGVSGIPGAPHTPSFLHGVRLETDASSWLAKERQYDLRVPSVTAVKLTCYAVKIIKRLLYNTFCLICSHWIHIWTYINGTKVSLIVWCSYVRVIRVKWSRFMRLF